MNIRTITINNHTEYVALRDIWANTFGDDISEIDALYDRLDAKGYILEENSVIKSCLTVYQAGQYDNKLVYAIYAVCTPQEERGKGYASRLVEYARKDIETNGHIAITCPATQELVGFYSTLGFTSSLLARERTVTPEGDVPAVTVTPINSKMYGNYREAFLKDIPHVIATDALLEQVQQYSIEKSGMLLVNNGDAICILDRGTDDEMFLSELLVNPLLHARSLEIIYEIAAGLAGLFETEKVTFKTSTYVVFTDEGGDHLSNGTYIQAMSDNNKLEAAYYGLPME